jgi:hypothetical protein
MKKILVGLLILTAASGAIWAQTSGGTTPPGATLPGTPGGATGTVTGIAMPSIVVPSAQADLPIGPDGTAYLVRPQVTIGLGLIRTIDYSTQILAVGLDKTVTPKWTQTISGLSQRVVAGDTYLYVLLGPAPALVIPWPVVEMPGTTTTSSTTQYQLLFLNYADGTQHGNAIKVDGQVQGMQVKTVRTTEYIYLTVVRSGASGQSSLGLVILNSAGNQVNALDAASDAPQEQ